MTGLSTADYKEFWQALCPLILATDAANKDDDAEFEAMAATGSFVFENAFHRRLFMRHLVQVADISNGAKPLEIARYWADCVTREFFAEGAQNDVMCVSAHAIVRHQPPTHTHPTCCISLAVRRRF